MKKMVTGVIVLTFLLTSFTVYADSLGTPQNNTGQVSPQRQQFLQETKTLRQEAHDLRCQIQAASQAASPNQQQITALRQELTSVRQQIQAKAAELGVTLGGGGGGQPRPLNCPGVASQ